MKQNAAVYLILIICLMVTGCGTTRTSCGGQKDPSSSYGFLCNNNPDKGGKSNENARSTVLQEQSNEQDHPGISAQAAEKQSDEVLLTAKKSLAHKILWYIPNRVLDVVDMFRLRIRGGPGLATNIRITNLANLYAGRYHTVFVGLPGPRLKPEIRYPVGLEEERGLIFMGIDASDDLSYEPDYSPTEFVLGLQFLLAGLEIGFDPVEIGDLICGFILIDPREDDR